MNSKQILRDFCAHALAPLMRRLAPDPRYFELWQDHGFHVSQVHYYQPLPDTRILSPSLWTEASVLAGVDMREKEQLELLKRLYDTYKHEYCEFPRGTGSEKFRYYLGNVAFEAIDAEILYCIIRDFKPRRVIEIGSGFSTLLAADALAKNCQDDHPGELTAIEPFPPPFLQEQLPRQVRLLTDFVQRVPLSEFETLSENDILFIDSSHVCKIGSDVHYEIFEILPRLKQGVVVHLHDIFFPFEYPKPWVMEKHLFWNEQYLLRAFLMFNTAFEILWAGHWMHSKHSEALAKAFTSYTDRVAPASFWMRRK